MPTAEKEKVIEQAKDWYSKSSGVVFADFKGLQVKEMQALRADLRKKGAEIHVLKNTLFRIAAGDDAANVSSDLHNGTTAYAFVFENEQDVAKALLDYARVSRKLVVKGGFFAGKSLTSDQVEQLSQLPSREVLISQVIGAIAAPLTMLVGTIEALYADPIRVIGAVADKVAKSNPIPTQESAPAPAAQSAAPAAEEPLSAAEEPTPVAEEAAPVSEEPAPSTEEPAPTEPASETEAS